MRDRAFTVLVAAMLVGCSQSPYAQWRSLDVVYASQVPIFPGAEVENAMGGTYSGESMGDRVSETMSWFFDIDPAKHDQIVAFYDKELTTAKKTVDEDGDVRFELVPKGAEDGESVYVMIGKDRLQIGEETKPGKHKES
jgi:hypothetical protein